jgi:hypothetical protein
MLPADASHDGCSGRSELGPVEAEYRTGHWQHVLVIVLALVFALFFSGIGVYVLMRADPENRWQAGTICALAVLGVPGVVFFWAFIILVRRLSWRLLVHEKGFLLYRGLKEEVVRWEDVRFFREKRIVFEGGIDGGHQATLRLESGKTICLDSCFRDIGALGYTIRKQTYGPLLERAHNCLRNHEPVSFGRLQLLPEGLRKEKQTTAWSDVESITVEPGGNAYILKIRTVGKRFAWYSKAVAHFYNLDVFMTLANELHEREV